MNKDKKIKKKRKGKSTQDLIGIKGFSNYGLATNRGELVFYLISPTSISVLSSAAIEIKTRHLLMILQSEPEIEIACLDSCQCFDENKIYIKKRLKCEQNPDVSAVLSQDLEHLDALQVTMATARQLPDG